MDNVGDHGENEPQVTDEQELGEVDDTALSEQLRASFEKGGDILEGDKSGTEEASKIIEEFQRKGYYHRFGDPDSSESSASSEPDTSTSVETEDAENPKSDLSDVSEQALEMISGKNILMDSHLEGNISTEEASVVFDLASQCLQYEPREQPNTKDLVATLAPLQNKPEIFESSETMANAIDLTGDGGVMKTIVRRAKPDAAAPSENLPLLDVQYEGILAETGEVFNATHEDNTVFTFELGKGAEIKAWDIALRTMKVGEVAKITCKSDYAYGSAGSPPEIPPNATLILEVELVACRPRAGSSLGSVSDERARLEELKMQREMAAALKEEEMNKGEEAKAAAAAAAAARTQAKMEAKKG